MKKKQKATIGNKWVTLCRKEGRPDTVKIVFINEVPENGVIDLNKIKGIKDIKVLECRFIARKGFSRIQKLVLPCDVTEVKELGFSLRTNPYPSVDIKEVVWPKATHCIPPHLFENFTGERVSNLDSVTEIGEGAFIRSGIKEINWPTVIKKVPNRCFSGCFRLEDVKNLEAVTEIGEYAFSGCAFKEFAWPMNVEKIPRGCFCGCSELKTVDGIKGVKRIGVEAFAWSGIRTLRWPDNCFKMEEGCLYHSKLEELYNFDITKVEVEKNAFPLSWKS